MSLGWVNYDPMPQIASVEPAVENPPVQIEVKPLIADAPKVEPAGAVVTSSPGDVAQEVIAAVEPAAAAAAAAVEPAAEPSAPTAAPKLKPKPLFTPESAGVDTKNFIEVESAVPAGFAIENTNYAIYDYDLCAPWGALQGHLLQLESWTEGGETKHAAIVLPSKPCMVLERTYAVREDDGMLIVQLRPRRVLKNDLIFVPLFESPGRLRKYVTAAWVTEMQFRAGLPPPNRIWSVAISDEQTPRASLNLV